MKLLGKIIKFARDAWVVFGIALLMLVAVETLLSLGFYIRGFWHSPEPDYRFKADTFAGASWAPQYYKEYQELGLPMWKPYVYWGRRPYQGSVININSDGIRKTYTDADAVASSSAIKVFMFGGSTMWGAAARDDFTIPSLFAKEIKSKGLTCKVTNFGQSGHVSTQEVIELLLLLQSGNIPDAVIFYDGVNDTFAAFQHNVAGVPQNEFNREIEFNLLQKKEISSLAVQDAIKQFTLMRFLNGILDRVGVQKNSPPFKPLELAKPISDKKLLAQAVVDMYASNIRLINALSESYGFKCLFYWQPVVYQKQHLTDYERYAIQLEYNFPGMKEFYEESYASLNKRAESLGKEVAFHDISSIFNEVREPLYIDYCHVSENGNGQIAKKMAEDFARLVR
jgi:lysophospholipase L1-like esterase